MTPAAALLLAVPVLGLSAAGFRSPTAWAVGACAVWAVAWIERRRLAGLGPWLPFLAVAAVSALASGQPAKSLPVLSRWAAYAGFFALASALWGEKERRWWLRGLLGAAPLLSLAALATGWGAFVAYRIGTGFTGFLPPHFGYTAFVEAAAVAAACAALLAREKDGPDRRWLWAVLVLCGGMILLARARAALLGAAAGVALALWRSPRGRKAAAFAAGLALAFSVAVSLAGAWPYVLKLDKSEAFTRPQLWRAAGESLAERPLLGEGPGQYEKGLRRHLFAKTIGVGRYGHSAEYAHSELVGLAAETGLLGLAALLFGAFRAFGPAGAGVEAEAALAAAAAMGTICLVDNALQIPTLGLLFAGALAVSRKGYPQTRPVGDSVDKSARGAALAVGAGLLLSLAAPIPTFLAQGWSNESGAPEARLERARKLERLYPEEPEPREIAARALQALRPPRLAEASEELARATGLAPFNAVYLVWRAELLRAEGGWEELAPLAGRAAELEPSFPQAELLLAEDALRRGERAVAARHLEAAEAGLERLRQRAAAFGVTGYDSFLVSMDRARYDDLRRRLH